MKSVPKRCGVVAVLAALVAMPTSTAFAGGVPCRYEIAHIIEPPWCGPDSPGLALGTGISPNGRYVCGHGGCANTRVWWFDTETGILHNMPHPPGTSYSLAEDVSDGGVLVGKIVGQSGEFGFIFDVNTEQFVAQLPPLVAPNGTCRVTAINSHGQVCGTRTINGPPDYRESAFVWTQKGGFIDLGLLNGSGTLARDLNDNGVVTGDFYDGTTTRAYTWDTRVLSPLPSLTQLASRGSAVTNDGRVGGTSLVPSSLNPFGVAYAVTWSSKGEINNLGPLPGDVTSFIFDMNSSGVAVGESRGPPRLGWRQHAAVWFPDKSVDVYTFIDQTQVQEMYRVEGISQAGCLVVQGADWWPRHVVYVLEPVYGPQGDVDSNCRVNVQDLLEVIRDWNTNDPVTDLDDDGIVDVRDLLIVFNTWTFDE